VAQLLDAGYPTSMSPQALVDRASRLVDQPPAAVEPAVMAMLEELLILGALRVRRTTVPVVASVSESPVALPAIRALSVLRTGAGDTFGTCNQWHEPVVLSLLERSLLPLLDGKHSHEALAQHLEAEVRGDRLRFVKDDKPLTEPSAVKEFARQQVALALASLRRKALLTA